MLFRNSNNSSQVTVLSFSFSSMQQKFCKFSDAKEAPDASTRATNLFRNQLIGMAPNLPNNEAGVPSTFLANPGSNQQRIQQDNVDQVK